MPSAAEVMASSRAVRRSLMIFIFPDAKRRAVLLWENWADVRGKLLKIHREDMWFGAITVVVVIVGTLAAILWPVALPAVAIGAVLLALAAKKPHVVSPILLLMAMPFIRPNILSAEYAQVGTVLTVAAALLAIGADKGKLRIPGSYLTVSLCVGAISLWLMMNASMFGSDSLENIFRGTITTVLTVAAAGVVLADPARRRLVGRGFVWIIVVLSASFAITFAAWLAAGFGSFQIAKAPGTSAAIYFPLTPTFGTQTVAGLMYPRFTGLGREPGWMSMYCGLALLLWPRVGRPRFLGVVALIAGLLGAFSTAGFGAFVVVVMIAWMARKPKGGDAFTHLIAFVLKLAALAGAAWLAIFAPVFGFASKGDLNETSLMDRSNATEEGLKALSNAPFGGVHTGLQGGINLIASLAPFGIPFFLAVCAALFLPRIGHPNNAAATAPVLLIFITLLLSQPAADSTWVFILTGLAYTSALPDALALNAPKERSVEAPSPVIPRIRPAELR